MKLSKKVALFHYILKEIGYDNLEELQNAHSKQISTIIEGQTIYYHSLPSVANSKMSHQSSIFTQYDENIIKYEQKLRTNRYEPLFTLKYYQYFALLFTEYYFDHIQTDKQGFIDALNAFKNSKKTTYSQLEDYTSSDLKKIAYWMATGSGKTLLMHCNYWQFEKYKDSWDYMILITPNERLSKQHLKSFEKSGIPARQYTSEADLRSMQGSNEVLIIEITKFTKDKQGEGQSLDVEFLKDSKNLIFIDEGHKGSSKEAKVWKDYRETLAQKEESFTIEYSATFGQIVPDAGKDLSLLQEYGKSILFDYSYQHFYKDGYGKDFDILNIDENKTSKQLQLNTKSRTKPIKVYSNEQRKIILTAALLSYYEQLITFEQVQANDEQNVYNVEHPLWVFVGTKVQEKANQSDISEVIVFLRDALKNQTDLQKDIDAILDLKVDMEKDGINVFQNRFLYLRQAGNRPTATDVLKKVCHGTGSLQASMIKNADGEIGLRTTESDKYFAVINIGDAQGYGKTLSQLLSNVLENDTFSSSLFHGISSDNSSIQLLIGSKKFIEGWSSWRVLSMTLLNMGKSEGSQIIQLFGRGIRLKGRKLSLKREQEKVSEAIKILQTLTISSINASYMNIFLADLTKEVPVYVEKRIPIKCNFYSAWNNKLNIIEKDKMYDFKKERLVLTEEDAILKRIKLDLTHKVSIIEKKADKFFKTESIKTSNEELNILHEYFKQINFPKLTLTARQFCLEKGYTNLLILSDITEKLIKSKAYKILTFKGQYDFLDVVNGTIQSIAETIIKMYITKFYSDREKAFTSEHLTYNMLSVATHAKFFPKDKIIRLKIPQDDYSKFDAFFKDLNSFTKKDNDAIPTLHFDKHLYSPLVSWKDKDSIIKSIPTALNEGETKFVKHLRQYMQRYTEQFKNVEVYLLRNFSRSGVGFFLQNSSFYPDFILWIIRENKQYITFIDPKGLMFLGNFNNEKVLFCSKYINEINEKMKSKSKTPIQLNAFILSVTSFENIKSTWENSKSKEQDFTKKNILFIEDNMNYIKQLFLNVIK